MRLIRPNVLLSSLSAVVADSPSGYWRMDDPTGPCSPPSAAGGAGSLTASDPCLAASGALLDSADASDGSIQFSGGYLSAANSSAVGFTGPFTLEAWINTDTVGQQGIVEKYDDPSGLNGYGLRLDSSNHLRGFVCNATAFGNCSDVTTTQTLAQHTWYLVDFVASGSTLKIYVNAAESASASQTQQPTAGSATMKVGAKGDDSTLTFRGKLDEVAIYPSALPATRITAHYTAAGYTE
jgi:hypothetical protein